MLGNILLLLAILSSANGFLLLKTSQEEALAYLLMGFLLTFFAMLAKRIDRLGNWS